MDEIIDLEYVYIVGAIVVVVLTVYGFYRKFLYRTRSVQVKSHRHPESVNQRRFYEITNHGNEWARVMDFFPEVLIVNGKSIECHDADKIQLTPPEKPWDIQPGKSKMFVFQFERIPRIHETMRRMAELGEERSVVQMGVNIVFRKRVPYSIQFRAGTLGADGRFELDDVKTVIVEKGPWRIFRDWVGRCFQKRG